MDGSVPLNNEVLDLTREIMKRYFISGIDEYNFLTIHLNCLFELGKRKGVALNLKKHYKIQQFIKGRLTKEFDNIQQAADYFKCSYVYISCICSGVKNQNDKFGFLQYAIKKEAGERTKSTPGF